MTYDDLVRERRDCRLCVDGTSSRLRNGSSFDFDPAVVSHWSQWLGHQRPRLLVVGQDFSGDDYFERNRGRDDPSSPTNRSRHRLLAEADIEAGLPPAMDPETPVYLTNSVLCLKSGAMSGPIKTGWVRNCARNHLAPLLDHLRPQAVVAMGGPAWRAVREVFPGTGLPGGIKDAAGRSWTSPSGCGVFAVGHCSGLGLANRPWQQQLADWREIGRFLQGVGQR
jgi:uracil-DNA glycosylase